MFLWPIVKKLCESIMTYTRHMDCGGINKIINRQYDEPLNTYGHIPLCQLTVPKTWADGIVVKILILDVRQMGYGFALSTLPGFRCQTTSNHCRLPEFRADYRMIPFAVIVT
jgi:hypothetical protein